MKIVLAYSGGLDTSVLVSWLKEHYNAEIITYAADVGQEEELDGLAEKAKATGASAHYTVDLVEEFARDFIFPMMRANAIYEGQYLLGTSIARPLIAKAHVEIAEREGADAVAHGATVRVTTKCASSSAMPHSRQSLKSFPHGAWKSSVRHSQAAPR